MTEPEHIVYPKATYTVDELAELTGVSRATIYLALADTNEVLGVRCWRVRSRWVIPKRPIDAALAIETEDALGRRDPN